MSTVNPTREEGPGGSYIYTWANMANGDVGAPIAAVGAADRSVQVVGTFGAGGNVDIQGSLEVAPSNYATLTDPQGNGLSFTSAKIEAITEICTNIRPNVTAGDGTTSLTVTILMRPPK